MVTAKHHGYFFAVVGPSGAGKDSLMDAARAILPSRQYKFAKRVVTRPPGQVGEDYRSLSKEAFAQAKLKNHFLLTWQAHGYEYGLEKSLTEDQAAMRHVIANCSRQTLKDLNDTVNNLVVLRIWASPETLAERLHKRGRETAPEISRRLNRETVEVPPGIRVIDVNNNGTLEEGQRNFITAIQQVTTSEDTSA